MHPPLVAGPALQEEVPLLDELGALLSECEAADEAGLDVGSTPSRKLTSAPGGLDGFAEMAHGTAPSGDVVGCAGAVGAQQAELDGYSAPLRK